MCVCVQLNIILFVVHKTFTSRFISDSAQSKREKERERDRARENYIKLIALTCHWCCFQLLLLCIYC